MTQSLTIIGRIISQGPQAPRAGDGLALPVYEYEVVDPAGELKRGMRVGVAHLLADVNDPTFAVGRLRRLLLSRDFPRGSTLLFRSESASHGRVVWFCAESTAVDR